MCREECGQGLGKSYPDPCAALPAPSEHSHATCRTPPSARSGREETPPLRTPVLVLEALGGWRALRGLENQPPV